MRRDLAELSAKGKLIRTHGGAVHKSALGENIPLSFIAAKPREVNRNKENQLKFLHKIFVNPLTITHKSALLFSS